MALVRDVQREAYMEMGQNSTRHQGGGSSRNEQVFGERGIYVEKKSWGYSSFMLLKKKKKKIKPAQGGQITDLVYRAK